MTKRPDSKRAPEIEDKSKMGISRIQLTISALRSVGHSAEEKQSEQAVGQWHVQTQRKDEPTLHSFQLTDPFNSQQNSECRWYLDQFVQQSPYSITRAATIAEALNSYARSLVAQLQLRTVVQDAVDNDPLRPLTMDLTIEEHDDCDTAINRLYWELLEDSSIWQPYDVHVTVTRLLRRQTLPGPQAQTLSSKSINLLLVVARDLSSIAGRYDDVDPSLATKILTNFQDKTRSNSQSVTLNVEIVRPGTRAALQQYLQSARNARGSSIFDIVHFDLHGEVDCEQQQAYLLFNSEDGSLQRDSAGEVAEILEQHSIPCVILNACESARADCGKDANMAQVFQRKGVTTFLGMSHKISSTAAEIFLTTFYDALLLKCSSFQAAAQEARAALRMIPEREARFGLQRSLLDCLVPVTYEVGSSAKRKSSALQSESPMATDVESVKKLLIKQKADHLYGRTFDLLRLEKLLQAHRCVFVSGSAGVGKTALLLEARRLWLKTRFVEIVCMAKFSQAKFTSSGEFVAFMIAQLPMNELEKKNLTDQMNGIVSRPSFETSEIAELFMSTISGRRCMFIFDDLHVAYTRWENKILGFPGRETMDRINQFISAIIKLSREAQYLDKVYLIFAGRVATLPAKLKGVIPYDFENISFPLAGLQMSDFIPLAQNILHKKGYKDYAWTNPELNELELALDLLQGLPGAVHQVLAAVASANVPIQQLRVFVQRGLCEATPAMYESDFFKQLLYLSESIKDGLFASLLALSLYWHEGPDMIHFAATMVSAALCEDDNALTLILSLAFEQGYIAFTSDLETTIIHPMFTTYGRVIANSTCKNFVTRSRKSSSSSFFGKASQWVTSLISPSTEKQELVAVFVKTMCDGKPWDDSTHIFERVELLRDRFIESVATKAISQWVSGHCKGTDFSNILSRWNRHLANLQTCVAICLCTPPIPVEKWPLYFFQQQAAGIRTYGTFAQAAMFAAELGRILQTFLELNGGYALQAKHQVFGLTMSSCLAATYNSELRNSSKFEHYVQCGLDIVMHSEAKYGSFEAFDAIYLKALLMRYKTLHLLSEGSQAEAEKLWQSMLDVEESLWNNDNSASSTAFSDEVTDALVANFSTDTKDVDAVRSHVQAIAGRSVPRAYYQSRKQSMQLIKLVGERRRQGVEFEKSREYKAVLMRTGLGMEGTRDAFESTGVQGIESDTRWWPDNLDMLKHTRRYRNPNNRLDDLEDAHSSGNVVAAAEHHQALLREALTRMDLDETGEHADALERIYEHDPAFEEQLRGVRQSKLMFGSLKSLLQALRTGSGHAGKGVLDVLANHQEVLARANAPQELTKAFGINMQILAKDEELYGNNSVTKTGIDADAEQTILQGMHRLMANIGDPDFIAEFPRVGLEMMNLLNEMQEAESSHDLEAEQMALEKYEAFSKLPMARDMVDHVWTGKRRKDLNRQILWKPHLDKWIEAMSRSNFEAARVCVEGMEHEQPDKWSSTWGWMKLLEVYRDTERAQWNTAYVGAMEAFNSDQFETAAIELTKLIDLHDNGAFSHLEPQGLATAFFGVRTNQLLSHVNIKLRASQWEKALDLCNEWFDFVKDKNESEITVERSKFVDVKEACEIQIHTSGYQKAVDDLKTADAMKHLMALYALSETQSQTSGMKRNVSTLLTKEILNEWQRKILTMRILQTFHALSVESNSEDEEEDTA